MRKYIIVNTLTDVVEQIIQYGTDKDFPTNWKLKENELVITVDNELDVQTSDVYYGAIGEFFIMDNTDTELEIESISGQLAEMESLLSDFQEATWLALRIDETKLPMIWQERLIKKRDLRARLALIR